MPDFSREIGARFVVLMAEAHVDQQAAFERLRADLAELDDLKRAALDLVGLLTFAVSLLEMMRSDWPAVDEWMGDRLQSFALEIERSS